MSPVLKGRPGRGDSTSSETAPGRSTDASSSRDLSKDAIFDILRSSRRRGVLHYLYGSEEAASIGTLAEQIAAVENNIEPEDLSSAQRKRVYIALYQCHLPKMADHEVIEYDDRGTVELSEPARLLLPYLYIDPDRDAFTREDRPGLITRLRARFSGFLR